MIMRRVELGKEAMKETDPERKAKLLAEAEKYKFMAHSYSGAFGDGDALPALNKDADGRVPGIASIVNDVDLGDFKVINACTFKGVPFILAGFPGIGKSTLVKNAKPFMKVVDSDSSKYSWIEENGERVRNPNFLHDYTQHLLEESSEGKTVLCSTHYQILEHLVEDLGKEVTIVVPDKDRKEEFGEIYTKRGDVFKETVMENWDKWIDDLIALAERNKDKVRLYILRKGVFLSTIIGG